MSVIAWLLAASVVLSACAGESNEWSACRIAGAPAAPDVVEASATEVWRWPSPASKPSQAVVNDTAVYWYEESGAVWRWVKGAAAAEELRPTPDARVWIRGLVAEGEEVYWAEADLRDGFQPVPVPPSRLLRLNTASLDISLLAEVSDSDMVATGIDASNVYVQRSGFGGPSARVSRDRGVLSDAPEIPEEARLFGERFYWIAPGEDTQPGELFVGRLSDPTLRSLGPIEGTELDIGPNTVLWHQDRYEPGPPPVLYQSFVLIDEGRGCKAHMPEAGESISFATAVDAEHVYWHSYNKVGSVTQNAGGGPSPELPDFPLYRMQLASGRVERIETPGISSPYGSAIIGQDAAHVYVAMPEGLVSIEKP